MEPKTFQEKLDENPLLKVQYESLQAQRREVQDRIVELEKEKEVLWIKTITIEREINNKF